MTNTQRLLYLNRKKLVIKDIEYIIDSRKDDVPQDIENSNREIDEMEEYIEMILVAANNDKNILEECENDLQEEYKIHLAKMQSRVNFVSNMNFFWIIIILGLCSSGSLLLEIFGIYRRLTIQELLNILSFATIVVGALLLSLKFIVENNLVSSISAYEYRVKLLKNAKIRASVVTIIPPSLDRITINPNKMNGQPCIRDLRLTVWRVIELLQTYPDRPELYREFPELTEEDIKQAIIYADINQKESAEAPVVNNSIAHETFA